MRRERTRIGDGAGDQQVESQAPLTFLWGVLLLGAGILFLADRLGLVTDARFFWAGMFAAVGAVFAVASALRREAWWAAIPAGALLGLGVVTAIGDAVGPAAEAVSGGAFLALTGAGFWAVYVRDHARWWAIIPGGALVTLGSVSAVTANDLEHRPRRGITVPRSGRHVPAGRDPAHR